MADKKKTDDTLDVGINAPFSEPAKELGEPSAPVPAQTFDESKDSNKKSDPAPLFRDDTGEVQPPPRTVARTVVVEPAAPAPQEQTITEATGQVAAMPSGGFVELARILFGDVSRADEIAQLNKDKIVNPDAVQVGQVVRVPAK
jgi:hypothetical protein